MNLIKQWHDNSSSEKKKNICVLYKNLTQYPNAELGLLTSDQVRFL